MRPFILDPSLLSADYGNLAADLAALEASGTHAVHFDMMDGLFVPSISMGFPVLKAVRANTRLPVDVHMMVETPIRYVDQCAASGADWITIHHEACHGRGKETLAHIRKLGCKAGLSIKPETPVEVLRDYLDDADLFLIMCVQPGFGGQAYIPESTERIRQTAELIRQSGKPIDLQVDGGISKRRLAMVLEAGANVVVAGTCLFRHSIQANIKEFLTIMDDVDRKRRNAASAN